MAMTTRNTSSSSHSHHRHRHHDDGHSASAAVKLFEDDEDADDNELSGSGGARRHHHHQHRRRRDVASTDDDEDHSESRKKKITAASSASSQNSLLDPLAHIRQLLQLQESQEGAWRGSIVAEERSGWKELLAAFLQHFQLISGGVQQQQQEQEQAAANIHHHHGGEAAIAPAAAAVAAFDTGNSATHQSHDAHVVGVGVFCLPIEVVARRLSRCVLLERALRAETEREEVEEAGAILELHICAAMLLFGDFEDGDGHEIAAAAGGVVVVGVPSAANNCSTTTIGAVSSILAATTATTATTATHHHHDDEDDHNDNDGYGIHVDRLPSSGAVSSATSEVAASSSRFMLPVDTSVDQILLPPKTSAATNHHHRTEQEQGYHHHHHHYFVDDGTSSSSCSSCSAVSATSASASLPHGRSHQHQQALVQVHAHTQPAGAGAGAGGVGHSSSDQHHHHHRSSNVIDDDDDTHSFYSHTLEAVVTPSLTVFPRKCSRRGGNTHTADGNSIGCCQFRLVDCFALQRGDVLAAIDGVHLFTCDQFKVWESSLQLQPTAAAAPQLPTTTHHRHEFYLSVLRRGVKKTFRVAPFNV